MNVAELKADLDPRPRYDEVFPDGREDARARVARAEEGLRQTNRTYGGYLGICAAIGGALIAGLVVMGLRLLGYAMRGAILG